MKNNNILLKYVEKLYPIHVAQRQLLWPLDNLDKLEFSKPA